VSKRLQEFRDAMQFRYTRHQVPRGVRADSETFDKIVLVKNVSTIRATYQVRLLAFKAVETGKKLVIIVPKHCRVDRTLREFMKELPKKVRVEKAA
jgi:hypothetical protein